MIVMLNLRYQRKCVTCRAAVVFAQFFRASADLETQGQGRSRYARQGRATIRRNLEIPRGQVQQSN